MMRRIARACSVLAVLAGTAFPALAAVPAMDKPLAVIRALDKITARVQEFTLPMERPFQFGTLTITVHACRVTPPEDTPEAAAFLEIEELKPGEQSAPVFRGWMFASSPALSAMENPIYDVWVTGCKDPAPVGNSNTPAVGKG